MLHNEILAAAGASVARMIDEQTGDSCRAQPATKKVVLVLLAQVQNAFWVRDDDSAEWNHESDTAIWWCLLAEYS